MFASNKLMGELRGKGAFLSSCSFWSNTVRHFLPSLKMCNEDNVVGFIFVDLDTISENKIRKLFLSKKSEYLYGASYNAKRLQKMYDFLDGVFDKSLPIKDVMDLISNKPAIVKSNEISSVQLLVLLRKGYSDKEISNICDLPISAVKYYLRRLYRDLGVSNRTQAAMVELEIDV